MGREQARNEKGQAETQEAIQVVKTYMGFYQENGEKTEKCSFGFLPEISEDQGCFCCSVTQLTWDFAREGSRQRRVCVFIFSLLGMKYVFFDIGTVCHRICLQSYHLSHGRSLF